MPKTSVTLIKGDRVSSLTDYRDALPVNMFAVKDDILGAQGYMLEYDGLTSFGTGEGIDRGSNYNERFENHYRVSGTSLISVSSVGVITELGTIPGVSQCRMKDFYSFNTQGIIADGKFFLYDPTDGFQEVTDSDLGSPIDGVWVDGYYFMTDGEYLFHTDIDDETSIDPLKFATAEFMPDPSLGVAKTQDNKVLVFGRYSLEYFINDASTNFAFSRVATRAQKIGIVATHAKCELGGNFFITGGRREDAVSIFRVVIGSSEKIATREIDKILKQYSENDLADMRMECRMEDDIIFVLVHLPNEVLCYNETIAKSFGKDLAWSILKSDTTGSDPYRAINGVFDARNALWIFGDKLDSRIGKLDESVVTHYEDQVEWILYTPFLNLDGFSIDEIEIATIPGFNSNDDAKVAMSKTENGLTYGMEYWNQYGSPKDYGKRFIFRRLGYVRDYVGFKFRGISTSKMAFALMSITYA